MKLFAIDDNKARGIDGFDSHFFKKAWQFIKNDIYDAQFFDSGILMTDINCTLVTLVPKVHNHSLVKDFRPIV